MYAPLARYELVYVENKTHFSIEENTDKKSIFWKKKIVCFENC